MWFTKAWLGKFFFFSLIESFLLTRDDPGIAINTGTIMSWAWVAEECPNSSIVLFVGAWM